MAVPRQTMAAPAPRLRRTRRRWGPSPAADHPRRLLQMDGRHQLHFRAGDDRPTLQTPATRGLPLLVTDGATPSPLLSLVSS